MEKVEIEKFVGTEYVVKKCNCLNGLEELA